MTEVCGPEVLPAWRVGLRHAATRRLPWFELDLSCQDLNGPIIYIYIAPYIVLSRTT